MLQNAYFLAKIGADTAENEQHFAEMYPFSDNMPAGEGPSAGPPSADSVPSLPGRRYLGKFCKFLAGSFSAESKRNFARKYAFDSIFHALQGVHTSVLLQPQNFSK